MLKLLFAHEHRVISITILMTETRKAKGGILRNTNSRGEVGWKIAVRTNLASTVHTQRLDKWNEFLGHTLLWKATPQSCTIGWVERRLRSRKTKNVGLWKVCLRSNIFLPGNIWSIQMRTGCVPVNFDLAGWRRISPKGLNRAVVTETPSVRNGRLQILGKMMVMQHWWPLMRAELKSGASRAQGWPENLGFARWEWNPEGSQLEQKCHQSHTLLASNCVIYTWIPVNLANRYNHRFRPVLRNLLPYRNWSWW